MVNAASSAVRLTVRLTGALMPSNVWAVAAQASAGISRNRCFMRCLSLREAVSDVGIEGVLRSGAAASGRDCACGAEVRITDITDAGVSGSIERFGNAPDAAQLQAGGGGQRLGLLLGVGEELR